MLQNLRERMQGIIAWAIVGVICLTFALWGIQSYLRTRSDTDTMAKVNGKKITQSQIRSAYERLRQKESSASGKLFAPDQKTQLALKKNILQQLIKNSVIMDATKKAGFYAGVTQINAIIESLPIFQVNGVFSPARYQQVLSGMLYTEPNFRNVLRRTVILKQLETGVVDSDFVLANELDRAVQIIKQKRDFGYLLISPKLFAKNQFTASQIQDYYNKHKQEFLTPEKVSISYIQLSTDNLKDKIKVNPNDLQRFYKEHAGLYQGKSFATIKQQVKKDFTRQQAMQLFAEQNDKLTDITYTSSDSLEPAASALGLKIQNTELFTKKGGKTGLIKNLKIVNTAFSGVVLQQGYNSNPVELSEGNVVVLRIKQHIPEKALPLSTVRQQVLAKMTAQSQQEQCQKLGAKILRAIQNQQNPTAIATQYNLHWQVVSKLSRHNKKIDAKVLSTAFNLPQPQKDKVVATGIDLGADGYAVVKVLKIYPGDIKQLDKKSSTALQQELQQIFGIYTYNLWVDGLMQHAKIKIEHEIGEGI